ncbi:MAG: hypothetical protein GY894_00260, partial [Planctomycetes bacterium]|nr:hypothetical protein [Planctomycetota bacterium]
MKMNGEGFLIEGNAISEALSLIAKGAGDTDMVFRAMADGMIDATESIAMGLGEAAVGTAEAFRIMTQDALVVESGLKKMGQTGVDAILAIDQESVEFRTAMEDNLLDQVEAVQFGLGYMGDIGRAEFESLYEWSLRATDTTAALGAIAEVVGDEFIQLGDKAVNALKQIDVQSDPVVAAMQDGIISATEAAALGFAELGERSVEQFLAIVDAAQGATT